MGRLLVVIVLVGVFISGCVAFSVVGNKIVDASGKEVRLIGMCRPSMEWSATGEKLSLADYTLMKSWGSNVVRIALNQDFWFSDAQGYKNMIEQQVINIKSLGMAVIIDLHWNNGGQQVMADTNSITFWTQVATKYANDPVILFELYNEPHDVSWKAWRDGEGNIAGMQQLYKAVRDTGANNVVLVGGLNYGYELSGVSQGYALTGTNIAYVTHPYDYGGKQPANWDDSFGRLAATYPIVMTEFGQFCNNNNYVAQLLEYITAKGIHWTAWAWFVGGCAFPSVISDWNGTPTPVGDLVKSYMSRAGSTVTTGTVGTLTTASSVTSTTGVPPPAGSSLQVYTDSLQNGFQDWSWADPRSLSDSSRTLSGSFSIKFAMQKFGALYFHTDNHFQLGAYQSFQFYVFSTTDRPASTVAVFLYDSSKTIIGAEVSPQTALVANGWTLFSARSSAFGVPLSTYISGVAIQGKSDPYIGDLWVDDVLFSTAGSSTSSATATTTSASSTTAKPTTTTASSSTIGTTTTKPTTTTTTTTATTYKPTTTTATTTKPTSTSTTSKSTTTTTTTTTTATTTVRPTTTTSTSTTTTSGSSGSSECGASHINIVQTAGNSWLNNNRMVYHYAISITSSCPTKALVGLTLTVQNWDPFGFWGATASGNTLTIANWLRVTPSSPFNDFGYQNYERQASFTVASYIFQ